MKIDAGFPRISPSGRYIACGGKVISVVDTVTEMVRTIGPGTHARWLNGDKTLVYSRQPDGALMVIDWNAPGEPREVRGPGHAPESVCTDETGRWALEVNRVIYTSDGRTIADAFRPQFAGTALCWGVDDGTKVALFHEGSFVADSVHQHRGFPDGRLVFTVFTPNVEVDNTGIQTNCLSTFLRTASGEIQSWALRGAYEFNPAVTDLAGDVWILSNTADERLLLRTGNNGIVVAVGRTEFPDIRGSLVCWEDGNLELQWRHLVIAGARDLRRWELAYLPPGMGWSPRVSSKPIRVPQALFGFSVQAAREGMPPFLKANGRHYTHPRQCFFSEDLKSVQEVKQFAGETVSATWTANTSLRMVGLAFDGTNEMQGYRLVNRSSNATAPLIPFEMMVGEAVETPVDIITPEGAVIGRRVLRFSCKSLWNGPFGPWACFTWDFSDHESGLYEESWCLLGANDNARDSDGKPMVGLRTWIEYQKVDGIPKTMTKTAYFWNERSSIMRPPFLFNEAYPASPAAPPPEPRPMNYFALQHIPSGRYLAIEPDGTAVVNRESPGVYETLTRREGLLGGVALFSPHTGKYLRASDPGEGADLEITAAADTINTYESFTQVVLGPDTVAFLTFHGGVWQVVNERLVGRLGPLDQHTWRLVAMSSVPGIPGPTPEPGESRIKGRIKVVNGQHFADDLGPVTPRSFHLGEWFSIWLRDKERAKNLARQVRAFGFDLIRPWFTLNVGNRDASFWKDRDCGPKFWPNFYSEVQEALEFCASIGLGVHFSYGDLRDFTNAEEDALADGIADICDRSPSAKSAIQFYEGLNEARDTGDADDKEPAEIERFVNRFRRRHPDVLCCLSAYTGHEDIDTLKAWTPDWQEFVLIHSYRGGHLTDKARHTWNESYELAGKVRAGLRTVKRGEPAGTGKWVSATENKHELNDPDAMHVYLLAMALSAGTVTFFSSAGVIADEPLEAMAGATTVCAILDRLPRDLGAGKMVHGGDRPGSPRIFAVPGGDETRCDHCILPDGRFACLQHGPRWRECYAVRDHRVETIIEFGQWGRLILGRV